MPNDTLLNELRQTFRQEAAEHVATLNRALLAYERVTAPEDRQAQIQAGFRAAHSLKGAARAVSLNDIQTVAHAIESVFQQVRDAELELSPAHCDTLYDSLDLIETLMTHDGVDTGPIQARLHAIMSDGAVEGTETSTPSAVAPKPVAPDVPPAFANVDETIRVPLDKLEDLMAEVGELLVARISTAQRLTETRDLSQTLTEWSRGWRSLKPMLKRHEDSQLAEAMFRHADTMHAVIERFQSLASHTQQDVTRLEIVTDTLQHKVRQVRMIPFSVHQMSLERVVRDAARVAGKMVRFELSGADTEVDKRVLEGLKDPLVHLLRNAVGHGIEPPDERGEKPETGEVTLHVWQRGSEVHLTITDDGRGLQTSAIRQAYQQRYGVTDDEVDVVQMAFMPGVTTASDVTELSGRGVGLDVVRDQLERIHGRFSVESEPGVGTRIHLIVPTSLAITRMLLVESGGTPYALPLITVEKIVTPDTIIHMADHPTLQVDDQTLPLAALSSLLGLPATTAPDHQLALVMVVGDQRLVVLVDDVVTEQELAVKPIGFPVRSLPNITGAALLGTGDPIVVLNPADFIASYRHVRQPVPQAETAPQATEKARPQARVLVVDDSITTRTLERNILKAANFDVLTATNGADALAMLGHQPVDVVVSDIEMPEMNGFELTENIRASDALDHLPVILVTSLERESDKERGMLAGADAYIVKRGFDQAELLSTINRLV